MKEQKVKGSPIQREEAKKTKPEQSEELSCETLEFNGEVYICCCDGNGHCECGGLA
ncbi:MULTISPECIES: hypothetical protein [Bacillus]|uniref:hypothetical protein n=1 Tax=Bacillus TaxID=1386 RepID=UPI001596F915|nr:hypothetical protein [Bacillus cereus]